MFCAAGGFYVVRWLLFLLIAVFLFSFFRGMVSVRGPGRVDVLVCALC